MENHETGAKGVGEGGTYVEQGRIGFGFSRLVEKGTFTNQTINMFI